jgi:hypothetical protein
MGGSPFMLLHFISCLRDPHHDLTSYHSTQSIPPLQPFDLYFVLHSERANFTVLGRIETSTWFIESQPSTPSPGTSC